MTNEEYIIALRDIAVSGRGFKAIIDLAMMMRSHADNQDSIIREMRTKEKERSMAWEPVETETYVGQCGTCRYLNRSIACVTDPPQYICVKKDTLVYENGWCDVLKDG